MRGQNLTDGIGDTSHSDTAEGRKTDFVRLFALSDLKTRAIATSKPSSAVSYSAVY